MAITHKVKTGETVGAIAERFGVDPSAVSGFRSNDPSVIFPDEILTIQQDGQPAVEQAGVIVDDSALQPTGALPGTDVNASPEATGLPIEEPVPEVEGVTDEIPPIDQPEPVTEPITTIEDEEVEEEKTFTTPSGVVVDEEGAIVEGAEPEVSEEDVKTFSDQYGFSPEGLMKSFNKNPFATLSDVVKQVLQFTGIADARANITNISNEIEELENARDQKLTKIQDDPFISIGTKQGRSQKIESEFENKIANRVNRLTLMQGAYKDARNEARFAATTAISLFNQERNFQADQIEAEIESKEKELEAEQKTGALTTEKVGQFTVLRAPNGEIISTIKPSTTSGTEEGFASSVEGWANILSRGQGTISNVPQAIRNQVVNYLNTNSIDIKKQLGETAITQIAQTESAIASLDDLRTVIKDNLEFVGPISGLARFNPWSDARKAQADIDRVRQTVGKALEGGVLRKEDEEKYKKILATLADTPETALYKIESLVSTLQRDLQAYKDEQVSAGRFVEGDKKQLSTEEARKKYGY